MALSINQTMFATVVSLGLVAVLGYGLMEYGRAKRQFDQDIAQEIGASTRMIRVAGEVQRLTEEGDYEGARALQERAMEQERERQESSPLLRRMQARRAGQAEGDPSREPAEHRVDGAFYPEDFAQQEPESSLPSALAVAVAGGGGVLVFGLVGFVAFQVLGSSTEEEAPAAVAEGEAAPEGEPGDGEDPA